ncbi:FecR family protein [Leadbettera azotonutricia]|uniref:FecR protein domain-containing protein n=1 Tax=Leadbettera azotonutricia (strain ATCC BAA-888 / DSM 13862 / ZAS-9) TaxID=545695 RepID=F5YEA1_LEAAZ|nr:FecR domain-containing protein [Leadbettera azotonutricia]AEF83089.1 conserved hypothetical protein [Leadbettera azotonutricia ZAS-9]
MNYKIFQKSLLAILFAVCAFAIPLFGQNANSGAVIRELSGTVEVKAPGQAAWSPASIGAVLQKDTAISTSFKSTAILAIGNSTLTVKPLTRLTIQELADREGNEEVGLRLQTGRIRAEVNPPAGGKTNFTIRSPSATASVRGTIINLDSFNVSVPEGTIIYLGADGIPAYVGNGQTSYVDSSGRTADPVETANSSLTPDLPIGIESNSSLPPSSGPGIFSNSIIGIGGGFFNPSGPGTGLGAIGGGWIKDSSGDANIRLEW